MTVAGAWVAVNVAWMATFSDEPWGTETTPLLLGAVVTTGVVWLLFSGWVWVFRSEAVAYRPSTRVTLALPALLPATIDIPDTVLSIYRDAVHFATVLGGKSLWPALPQPIEAATQTCFWAFAALALYVSFVIQTARQLQLTPSPSPTERCPTCRYPLKGLDDVGGLVCPECGEPVAQESAGV